MCGGKRWSLGAKQPSRDDGGGACAELNELEWEFLIALKREFTPEEIQPSPWVARAREAGLALDEFCRIAESLNDRKVIGRFSTFLEHVKPSAGGVRVTRFNALFHWAVPAGREMEAGGEVGRHHILTHCYWREAGPEFKNVNIMAVAHGTDKPLLLEHKRRSMNTWGRAESRWPTPMFSGADAARSSPRRSRRTPIASGCRNRGRVKGCELISRTLRDK